MAILQIPEHTPEWYAIRAKHVGGSEIAGLADQQADYQQSAYTLWNVKAGRIPPPFVDSSPGTRIWFGLRLEASIAHMAAELHGWQIKKGGYAIDDLCPGKAASIDYDILEPGPEELKLGFSGPGAMQVKNLDFLVYMRTWTEEEPPPHIILQLQHDISSAGYTWGCVVGMVGGNQIEVYRYAARPRVIDGIRQFVKDFWKSIADGKPPLVDGSDSTFETLRTLFPPRSDDLPIDLTSNNEIEEVCTGFAIADADFKAAEKNRKAWSNRLNELMKGHRRGVSNYWNINGIYTPPNPGRPAVAGEIIGKRSGSLWYKIIERHDPIISIPKEGAAS